MIQPIFESNDHDVGEMIFHLEPQYFLALEQLMVMGMATGMGMGMGMRMGMGMGMRMGMRMGMGKVVYLVKNFFHETCLFLLLLLVSCEMCLHFGKYS